MLEYRVQRNGSTFSIIGGDDRISFEMTHPELAIENDGVFAAWAVLPIGMHLGRDIRIDGLGDDRTAENAARLSRIWSTWLPDRFAPVSVSFSGTSAPRENTGEDLVLYSGGVDSCFNVLRRHEGGRRQALLTMDGYFRPDHFNALMQKTAAFREAFGTSHIIVKTNSRRVYKDHGMTIDITHGFAFAAILFLMRSSFRAGAISADYSRAQEFLAFPWGTNSVTNALFESSDFRMETDDLDVTRTEKLADIAKNEFALHSLSFCFDKSVEPENCGRCTKCVRTKAMFMAAMGCVPPVFIDQTFNEDTLSALVLSRRSEQAFAADLIAVAKRNGTASLMPGFGQLERRLIAAKQQVGLLDKIRMAFVGR